MATDLTKESVIRLAEVPSVLPQHRDGRTVHEATVRRWANVGLKGRKLETFRIGAIVHTTTQAVDRFLEHCSSVAPA